MFILDLISCPDEERLGRYTFYYPKIVASKNLSECHLYLSDPEVKNKSLSIEENQHGLEICERSGGFYLSNHKKISGKKTHQAGDVFGLGQCLFQIISITPNSLNLDTESRYHELTEKHPYMADLFWSLKQELLWLEKNGID